MISKPASDMTAEDYLFRGLDHWFMVKDFNAALADFDEAIRLQPDFAEVYNQRGQLRRVIGDYVGARGDYAEALRLNPSYANVHYNWGILCCDTADFEGAITHWETCAQMGDESIALQMYILWAKQQITDTKP